MHTHATFEDPDFIKGIVDGLILSNPDKWKQVKQRPPLIGWFVGQAMKLTRGKADPKLVSQLLTDRLRGR